MSHLLAYLLERLRYRCYQIGRQFGRGLGDRAVRIVLAIACTAMLGIFGVGCARQSRGIVPVVNSTNAASSPGNADSKATETKAETIASVDPQLVAAQTQFAFKLFSQLSAQQVDRNTFISPTSVAMALSMVHNGARGETQQAIANTLGLQGMSLEALNSGNQTLKSALEGLDETVKLAIANSLWLNTGTTLDPSFLTNTRSFYQAEVATLDLRSPDAPATINRWINEKTNGKITSAIDRIEPETVLLLMNAVYFKGKWSQPFDPKNTSDRPFTPAIGSAKTHPFMSQSGNYRYLETDKFQAIRLPYGSGDFGFYVFLPQSGTPLSQFIEQLNAETWKTWMSQLRSREGSIQLPRFQLEYDVSLNEVLKTLGMEVAFNPAQADFSGISPPPPPLAIGQVKHKTVVEVNEEGTEAAASTGIEISVTSAPSQPPFTMIVDRPFFCAIADDRTNTILFLGKVAEL
jgi:serine protease inhibitor